MTRGGAGDPAAGEPADGEPEATEWRVWTMTARLLVTRPGVSAAAERLVREYLAEVEAACSRFRDDSELAAVHRAGGRPTPVSPLLARLVGAALAAARRTGGRVDPTVGAALCDLGYDRSIESVAGHEGHWPERRAEPDRMGAGDAGREVPRLSLSPAPDWRRVRLADGRLTVPAGTVLDLGATAKAYAADEAVQRVARTLDTGVLLSLGGDIATAGPAPAGGWRIRVQDRPGDPACEIRLGGGAALATSSTVSRRWRRGGATLHHIIDPRTGAPADPVWRTASVAAARCVAANAASTAAIVGGPEARRWLRGIGLPARLVAADGAVVTLGGWPDPAGDRPGPAGSTP